MGKIIKKVIIFVVVAGILFAAYTFISGKKDSTNSLVTVGETPENPVQGISVGEEFLNTLLNMQAIKLNGDIFSSPSFTSLKDYSITLVQLGNQGRANPFAPIGADTSVSTVVQTVQITTNPVTQTTQSSVVANASLASGVIATERWFEWGLTQTLGAVTVKQTSSTAPFTATIAGLSPATTYYVKAAAKIDGQIVYGSVISFKTLSTGLN